MVLGIFLVVSLWLAYHLLVKGVLWKIVVAIFGWFGMFIAMGIWFPSTTDSGITISDTLIPWCWVVPSIIVLLSLAYYKDN